MSPASTHLARPVPGAACGTPEPVGEPVRLLALRASGLLRAAPAPGLLPTLRDAARLFDLPVAAVSLLDRDRDHLHAAIGLDARDLPRRGSFCAHAILEHDQVLVAEDAAADPRLAAHKLVAGPPRLRFHAGVPLLTGAGQPLGACWIADARPRRLTPRTFARLVELAARVAGLMDLRIALGERQKHRPPSCRPADHPALDDDVRGAATRILAGLAHDGGKAAIEAALAAWAAPDGRLGDGYRHRVDALCALLYRLHRQDGDARLAAARHAVLTAAW